MLPNYQYHDNGTGVLETQYKKEMRDYQIWGNFIQDGTPSPDNPIEIQSVGEKTANLFDIEKFVTLEGNSNYYKIENGNLVQVANDYRDKLALPTIMTLEAGTYVFSNFYRSNYYLVNKTTATLIGSNPLTLTETTEIAIKWWAGVGVNLGNPMVNIGEVALPFEPYGKYKIPIEVSGKNLFDMKTFADLGFELQEDGSYFGNSYTISSQTIWTNTEGLIGSFYIDGVMTSDDGILGYAIRTFYTDGTSMWGVGLTDENKTVDYVQLSYSRQKEMYLSNFIIANTSIETSYEPYKEPENYNIFLDEPLRKCGNYEDYIDFKNSKVIRKINKRYLSDLVYTGTQYANGLCRFQQSLPNTNYTVAPISNCMIGSNKISAYKNVLSLADDFKNLYAYFLAEDVGLEPVETTISNVEIGEAIKNYVTDKNIYFYHVFQTSMETEIELPKIQLNKGTNIIKVKTIVQPYKVNWQYYK